MSVLSISSHVVHGYVGNRAITFPLQYLGWNVDAVHTVHLSNHPGYGRFAGETADAGSIREVFEGLELIGSARDSYELIISGYAPNAEILEAIEAYVSGPAHKRPFYVMDPILGDEGRLYVKEEVVPVYKRLLRSGLVGLITPNQFEFELFSGVAIADVASLQRALAAFAAAYSVPNVVVSSVTLDGKMYGVGFSGHKAFLVPIPEIHCKFWGCGDLFTALVAHSFHAAGALTPTVLQDSIWRLNQVLQRTYDLEVAKTGAPPAAVKDIAVVASRDIYVQRYDAVPLDVQYLTID